MPSVANGSATSNMSALSLQPQENCYHLNVKTSAKDTANGIESPNEASSSQSTPNDRMATVETGTSRDEMCETVSRKEKKKRAGPRKRRRKKKHSIASSTSSFYTDNSNHEETNRLAGFLRTRPSARELLRRNIIKEENYREEHQRFANILGEKLRSRPTMRALRERNVIKDTNPQADPLVQVTQHMILRSQELDSLSRSLKNRHSWRELSERGIIKGPIERQQGHQKDAHHSHLADFLTHRPSIQSLLQSRVLQEIMMWSELELNQQPKENSSPPSARNCHSATLIRRRLYFLGGFSQFGLACVPHILDIDHAKWTVPALGPPPTCNPVAFDHHREGSSAFVTPATNSTHDSAWTMKELTNQPSRLPSAHNLHRAGTSVGGHFISNGPWPVVIPAPRYAHAACAMGSSLVAFGGYGEGRWLNDTWIYDTDSNSWAPGWIVGCETNGNYISGDQSSTNSCRHGSNTKRRQGRRASYNKSSMLQGSGLDGRDYSSVCPAPRAAHSVVSVIEYNYGDLVRSELLAEGDNEAPVLVFPNLVLYGGNNREQCFDDVWILRCCGHPTTHSSTNSPKYTQMHTICQDQLEVVSPTTYTPMRWVQPNIVGTPPSARSGHSACLKDDMMIVFGGSEGWGSEPLNDLYILDVSSVKSRRSIRTRVHPNPTFNPTPNPSQSASTHPSASTHLSASTHPGKEILQYTTNEQSIMRTDWMPRDDPSTDCITLVWYRPSFAGTPPPARSGHCAAMIDDKMFVFGGGDARRAFNDLHILDTSVQPMTWSRPCDIGGVPSPRSALSGTAIGSCFVVFGGGTPDGKLYSDLYVLDTSCDYPPAPSQHMITSTSLSTVTEESNEVPATYKEDNMLVFGGTSSSSIGVCETTYTGSMSECMTNMSENTHTMDQLHTHEANASTNISLLDDMRKRGASTGSSTSSQRSMSVTSTEIHPRASRAATHRTSFRSTVDSTSMLVAALDKYPLSPRSTTKTISTGSKSPLKSNCIGNVEPNTSEQTSTQTSDDFGAMHAKARLLQLKKVIKDSRAAEEEQYAQVIQLVHSIRTQRQQEMSQVLQQIDGLLSECTHGPNKKT